MKIKRIYGDAAEDDGYRVLVDRIWPRGLSKEKANLDAWMKEIAPSHELRKWFSHEPKKFPEFSQRYKAELAKNEEQRRSLIELKERLEEQNVTLLYAAKDEAHNQAVVLKEIIDEM
ncbi:DUF488 domain-containing protein [Pueribacillus theae]|uniref:DUF488 domain-containing protein n=1 Tax=Pueribacillus theae TaxID=2171751 RepID=A0A2U1K6D8_9BACI|nr:DUF488 domain-containing protein [Pueribacillus theae]